MRALTVCVLLAGSSLAFEFPFQLPFFKKGGFADAIAESNIAQKPARIAIVGAGAGGSSAAFWISKAVERFGLDIAIDVYDKESYIGGRSTVVYPNNDTSLNPMELGASIFVKANRNLWRASDEFNLTRVDFEDESGEMGIWDGQQFLLRTGGSGYLGQWWSAVKVLWRYGYSSPTKTQKIVKDMINQFLRLYDLDSPRWDNIASLASTFGWVDMANQTTLGYLENSGISNKFTREMVEAATRVNYGQDVDEIHALEGACSLAATGAAGILGGNYQMFEQFLQRSKAKVFLNEAVQSIKRKSSLSQLWTVTTRQGSRNYKAVVIAAPFHSTGISFPTEISSQVPEQPYVHLHVTLLSTTAKQPNPAYFSLPANSKVPSMVLTSYEGVRQGGKAPEFNSLSYHGRVAEGVDEWTVKIFSKEPVSNEWLEKIFPGQVGWVYRKEWDAYPKLPPTSDFPPVKLDEGLYYVNAFEPFISTMETETIASRNVVDLLLNENFATGICGPTISSNETVKRSTSPSDDFVLGWDC